MIASNPTTFSRGKPNKIHEDNLSQDEYDDNVYDDVDKDETEVEEEDFSDKKDESMTSATIDEREAEEEDCSDEDDKSTTCTIEDNDTDPWEKLRVESLIDLNMAWEEQVEQYTTQGLLNNGPIHS